MSEHITPAGRRTGRTDGRAGEQAVDRLLADSGLDDARDIRAELLELRSLASTAPPPSAAVRALMISDRAASGRSTTAEVASATAGAPTAVLTSVQGSTDSTPTDSTPTDPTPTDELAARRRRKRRTAIAGLAVAVSLAGGATAAAASEGGIPGAFQHLGSTIGSVVSQLTPGSGNGSRQNPGSPSEQERGRSVTPATPYPSGRNPAGNATSGNGANPGQEPQSGTNGASGHSNSPKAPNGGTPETPKIPGNGQPGNISIPTPAAPITPPGIEAPNVTPPTLRQSDIPVPVPTHVVPEEPVTPGNG